MMNLLFSIAMIANDKAVSQAELKNTEITEVPKDKSKNNIRNFFKKMTLRPKTKKKTSGSSEYDYKLDFGYGNGYEQNRYSYGNVYEERSGYSDGNVYEECCGYSDGDWKNLYSDGDVYEAFPGYSHGDGKYDFEQKTKKQTSVLGDIYRNLGVYVVGNAQ